LEVSTPSLPLGPLHSTRIKALSLHGKVYILVTWPESQEFMDALGAFLILDPDIAGSSAYMVPEEVFQNYRTPFHNGSHYTHSAPPPDEYNSSSDDDDDYDDSMCGDHESALASVGWGSEF
jgi:hypothetical protein